MEQNGGLGLQKWLGGINPLIFWNKTEILFGFLFWTGPGFTIAGLHITIKIKCKGEIISIEIGLKNGKYICLSSFYRVGDLGDENHRAVDTYLRCILRRKKCSKFVLIGDLNLNKVSWPSGTTTCQTQNLFLETFNELNLYQLINKPTHNKDGILDMLLTNSPE